MLLDKNMRSCTREKQTIRREQFKGRSTFCKIAEHAFKTVRGSCELQKEIALLSTLSTFIILLVSINLHFSLMTLRGHVPFDGQFGLWRWRGGHSCWEITHEATRLVLLVFCFQRWAGHNNGIFSCS